MILISRKVDYAILALRYLEQSPAGASARELACHYGLSRSFVANILKQLCQRGYVESHRGVHGGYRLAKPARDITLAEIIEALDGPFQLLSCASDDEQSCRLEDVCPVKSPLKFVHDRLLATLSDVTLEDLVGQQCLHDQPMVTLQVEGNADGCTADLLGQ